MLVDTGTSTAGLVAPQGKIPTVTSGQVVAGTADRALTRYSDTATAVSLAAVSSTGYVEGNFLVFLDSSTSTTRVAGTYTYTVVATPATGVGGTTAGTAQTIDISFVVSPAASASTTVSPGLSTAFIGTSSGPTSDAAINALATASATPAAYVRVNTYNASSVAVAESITATISGAGILSFGGISGASLTVAGTGSSDISVLPDGRAGNATITISTTTRNFAAKTMSFYAAAPATLTASVPTPILGIGANSDAIRVTAVDAAGINWAGAVYVYASTAADALIAGSNATPVACHSSCCRNCKVQGN
jgi:hypothetical protein